MPQLDCTHKTAGAAQQVCVHLLEARDTDYLQVFTGQGRTYQLACRTCANEKQMEAIPWRSVCDACFAQIEEEGFWDGIRSTPQVREEVSRLSFVHRPVAGTGNESGAGLGPLRLVQPVPEAGGSLWVGLTFAGALVEIDLGTGSADSGSASTCQHITDITASDINLSDPVSLTCSPDCKFLCLTQTLGNDGVVIDRTSGRRTLKLERDGYQSHASPFPTAFVVHKERTLLVHGTAWNRLDASDPSTGELLTERSPTSYQRGEQRPAHYLDYFHGRLLMAPDQNYIADDGWVWHPVGVVRTWSVRRWLEENRWESEDGPSAKSLTWRDYFWGGPMCWIDAQTLAVWGYGRDDEWIIPAVRLFDVVSGEERGWFPGPEVASKDKKIGLEVLVDFGGRLFFDRYLFAVSERLGVSVWNVEKGTRLYQDPSFAPVAYHPVTREFLTILPDGTLQLSQLMSKEQEQ